MPELKDLLQRFEKLLGNKQFSKNEVLQIVFEVTGVRLKTNELEIKNNVIFLKTKPIFRNEIIFKQEAVLGEINKKIPTLRITGIR